VRLALALAAIAVFVSAGGASAADVARSAVRSPAPASTKGGGINGTTLRKPDASIRGTRDGRGSPTINGTSAGAKR